jgi:hypothetical protein
MTVLLSQESTSSYFDVGTSSLEMTLPHGHVAGPKVLVGLYLVYLSDLWRIYIYASVPVRNPFDMGPSEGVSLVQRSQISMVLKKVGYTHNKVAILTTQNASQLHLRGYPCQELSVRVRVLPDDGSEPKEVYIRRFLIQLGFGPHVEPKSIGEKVQIPETMVKLVAKLPLFFGWTPEAIRGSTLTNLLSQHVNLHAIESLQTRKDHSATFFVHQSVVPDL